MRTSRRQAFILSLSLMICVLALTAPRRAAAYGYVTNGSFEDGSSSWFASALVQFDTVGESEVVPHEGASSAKIVLSSSVQQALRQTSWLGAPAGSYHLSGWVRTTSAGVRVSLELLANPSSQLNLESTGPPNQWQLLEGDIQIVGSTSLAIIIGVNGAAGSDAVYIDDVRLDGAAPATMTPTATDTAGPTVTPPPGATSTRTPSFTKTPAPTKTPRPTTTPSAVAAASIGSGLANVGFEAAGDDGVPTAWQKYGGALRSVDAPVRNGSHAARLESGSDSTKWLYQTVLVEGGSSYEFGAWIAVDDPGVAASFLRVSWYASDDGSGTALDAADSTERLTSPASGYRQLNTGSISAPAGAHSARLRIMLAPASAAPAAIYADDASFGPADAADAAAPSGAVVIQDEAAPPAQRVLGDSSSPSTVRGAAAPATASSESIADVVINEVLYDPDGVPDAAGEWVELYNPGDVPVSLAGWSLADAASGDTLAGTIVDAHGYVVLAASDSFHLAYPDFAGTVVILGGRIGNSLGNDGDRLILRDRTGAIADAISWGTDATILSPAIADAPSGHSIERRTPGGDRDSASDFVDNLHPSPGGPFVPAAARLTTQQRPYPAQTLAGNGQSFQWLVWSLIAAAGAALTAVVSWRAVPALKQRIRHHA